VLPPQPRDTVVASSNCAIRNRRIEFSVATGVSADARIALREAAAFNYDASAIPVGCGNPDSCRADVLVNDTAETISAHNASFSGCRWRYGRRFCRRWREGQRAMQPVPVVVIDEPLKDPLKVLLVENQQPVATL